MAETPLDKLKMRVAKQVEKERQAANRLQMAEAKLARAEKAIQDAKAFAIGRALLAKMEKSETFGKMIMAELGPEMTSPRHRHMFGLDPLPEPSTENVVALKKADAAD
jgi:ABC-type Fe3+-citrate transport system substrate-binding protein